MSGITPPRLLITLGEPAGIGPDIVVKIAQNMWESELIAVGDPDLLQSRAKLLNLPLTLQQADLSRPARRHEPGTLNIIPIALNTPCEPGVLNPLNANYVLETLKVAAKYCLNGKAQAVVTTPVHKSVINAAGIPFSGHTEFFAEFCQVKHTVMLFVADELRVALTTTHLPLAQVPAAITEQKVIQTLQILHRALKETFHLANPTILVCGVNPHAGESGYLGREEIDTLIPALEQARKAGMKLVGPVGADTAFTQQFLQEADAVLAMYHDQALPVVKQMSFGHAVNMTLGLPFIRTSVDHGTALDAAGTMRADAGSLEVAVGLAERLAGSV